MSFTDEHHEFSHHSICIAILISRVLHVKWRQRLQASKLLRKKKRSNINTKEGTELMALSHSNLKKQTTTKIALGLKWIFK